MQHCCSCCSCCRKGSLYPLTWLGVIEALIRSCDLMCAVACICMQALPNINLMKRGVKIKSQLGFAKQNDIFYFISFVPKSCLFVNLAEFFIYFLWLYFQTSTLNPSKQTRLLIFLSNFCFLAHKTVSLAFVPLETNTLTLFPPQLSFPVWKTSIHSKPTLLPSCPNSSWFLFPLTLKHTNPCAPCGLICLKAPMAWLQCWTRWEAAERDRNG